MLLLFIITSFVNILAQENGIAKLRPGNQLPCASLNNNVSAWEFLKRIFGKYKRDMTCFDFYAYNESSIYFRWNPPISSTEIELYRIKYVASSVPENLVVFKPTPCTIWPWMHCTSIHNLLVNIPYRFEISVKYNNTEWAFQAKTRSLRRQTSNPDRPIILRSFWDKYYNLTVEWQYPNRTNGMLKLFQIDFNKTGYMVPVETPHLNYSYSIDYRNSLDVEVMNVSITCKNKDSKRSTPSIMKIDCPPPTPRLSQQPVLIQVLNKSIELSVPQLENAREKSYLHVIVTKIASEGDPKVHPDQTKFISQLIDLEPNTIAWMAAEYHFYGNTSLNITIGDKSTMFSNITKQEIANWDLPEGVVLNIFIVVLNKRKEFLRFSRYNLEVALSKAISPFVYASFLVLITITGSCIYIIRKKRIRFVRF